MFKTLNEEPKNPFFKNIGKKILALAIAIALWFVANTEHDVERTVTVDVNYANLPSELVITNKPPEKLNVRVRGPRTQLASLSPRSVAFTVDLANAPLGGSKFEVQTDQIKTPRGVQVIGISPAEIKVEIDRLTQKEVGVRPVISGPADTGYEVVGEPGVSPSKVEVRGPQKAVSKIDTVPTDSISVTGVKSKFTIQVPLKSPHPLVDVVGDEIVQVTVDVREQTVAKQFKDIDIEFINFDNRDFEPLGSLKAELEFEGPYSFIRDLNNDDIKVFVDGSSLKKGEGKVARLEVGVNYPNKEVITLKKKTPKAVEIKLN